MSVTVLVHVPIGDLDRVKRTFALRVALMEEISEESKSLGALHHQFLESNGELVVVDEWETAEGFHRFFDANPKIEELNREVGVLGPPQVLILSPMEAPGAF